MPNDSATRRIAELVEFDRLGVADQREFSLTRINDPDFEIRSGALFHLAELKDPKLVGVLAGRLSDPEAYLRQRAIRGLADIDSDEARVAIRSSLDDPDRAVRGEASRALARLTRTEPKNALRR